MRLPSSPRLHGRVFGLGVGGCCDVGGKSELEVWMFGCSAAAQLGKLTSNGGAASCWED